MRDVIAKRNDMLLCKDVQYLIRCRCRIHAAVSIQKPRRKKQKYQIHQAGEASDLADGAHSTVDSYSYVCRAGQWSMCLHSVIYTGIDKHCVRIRVSNYAESCS